MSKQPEVLRIASELDDFNASIDRRAAKELRRLHALNAELLEALKRIEHAYCTNQSFTIADIDAVRAVIARTEP